MEGEYAIGKPFYLELEPAKTASWNGYSAFRKLPSIPGISSNGYIARSDIYPPNNLEPAGGKDER